MGREAPQYRAGAGERDRARHAVAAYDAVGWNRRRDAARVLPEQSRALPESGREQSARLPVGRHRHPFGGEEYGQRAGGAGTGTCDGAHRSYQDLHQRFHDTRKSEIPLSILPSTGAMPEPESRRMAVELDRVTVSFDPVGSAQIGYTAIRDLRLSVADGEFLSVVGPTGCGKSTILNVVAGLLRPTSGSVTIFGEPLIGINRRAGYLFQADATMPWRNVLRNVVAGLEIAGVPEPERLKRGREWLPPGGVGGEGLLFLNQIFRGARRRLGG